MQKYTHFEPKALANNTAWYWHNYNLFFTSYSYGQEFTFSIHGKGLVAAKWTGPGRPSKETIDVVNKFLKHYKDAKEWFWYDVIFLS